MVFIHRETGLWERECLGDNKHTKSAKNGDNISVQEWLRMRCFKDRSGTYFWIFRRWIRPWGLCQDVFVHLVWNGWGLLFFQNYLSQQQEHYTHTVLGLTYLPTCRRSPWWWPTNTLSPQITYIELITQLMPNPLDLDVVLRDLTDMDIKPWK